MAAGKSGRVEVVGHVQDQVFFVVECKTHEVPDPGLVCRVHGHATAAAAADATIRSPSTGSFLSASAPASSCPTSPSPSSATTAASALFLPILVIWRLRLPFLWDCPTTRATSSRGRVSSSDAQDQRSLSCYANLPTVIYCRVLALPGLSVVTASYSVVVIDLLPFLDHSNRRCDVQRKLSYGWLLGPSSRETNTNIVAVSLLKLLWEKKIG